MDKKKLLKLSEDIKTQFRKQKKLNFDDFINSKNYDIIKTSNTFDEEYYFSENPDVKQCNYDPIEHYITVGAHENCNPNKIFNTQDYLFNNPDVAKSDFNPYVHYLIFGFNENRKINNHLQKEEIFVSIIMPTFNRKEIISNAIDSIIKQNFQNFELIIVDDGSEDHTEQYIKRKYKQFLNIDKIRYFKINHKGVAYARNFGLNRAKGNLIAYLDTDNEWHEDYLKHMTSNLNKNPQFNCAYCEVQVIDNFENKKYVLNKKFNRKKILKENFIDINSFIHEKNLFTSKGGFDSTIKNLTDWDLIIKYTENNNPLFVNEKLVKKTLTPNLKNISKIESVTESKEKIQEKYWPEIYADEYESIVDIFDQHYYLTEYEDVLKSGMHPIYHYLIKGHDEGKNPNPNFVTSYYVNKYPDVIRNDLNTFYHYSKWGDAEGRDSNYFEKYNDILNNNQIYLSNYTFKKEPLVSIIILNRNGLNHLKRLFKNFSKKTNYSNFEIIVVDNNSTDDSVAYLRTLNLPIKIIKNTINVSFAKGNNDAAKIANGEYLLLLNNDMEPTYGWLNEMMGTIINNKNVGAVGAKLIYPFIENERTNKYSFTIQHAGDIFREESGICIYKAHNQNKFLEDIFDNPITTNRKCILVTGATLLTKRDIYLKLGGLDENFWYGYEDVDYNLRLYKHGFSTIFASAALLFHHESATRKNMPVTQNHELLRDKWSEYLFPKILKDKIEGNKFFTDKPLNFL